MANVDNKEMTDSAFRNFIRTTLPIVEKQPLDTIVDGLKEKVSKYY